ncbi:MAG: FecR domain-containing protein [Bacteroidales bacterium]|nr:FecR domain-containing protein [Bacteroidales bacterium]
MNKPGNFTEKEWEELASILSGEKSDNPELIERFMENDLHNTGDQWKKIKDMGSSDTIDIEKAWKNVSAKISLTENSTVNRPVFSLRSTFMKIAAVALVLMSIGTGAFLMYNSWSNSKRVFFSTGNDEKNLLVELTDGSRIYLNRDSELSYSKDFGKTGRNVKLRGEAFFEISRDASKPFTIDAGNAYVKVVGTSFNVITSNQHSEVEVFVKTGKVLVSGSGNSESLELDPGYVGKIDSQKAEKTINTDPNYLSWNTGLLVYNGQTLDVVFKDLKRVYNMDIIADDSSILENRWTSPIDNQTQETIIRLICTSFNLSYSQEGNVFHLVKK